ncbi:MAG: hypothetical protein OXH15_05295 [Gammaproteobacteria bacterium]|nr:hypothetical protein [Gammaproteobacteria bacterium]
MARKTQDVKDFVEDVLAGMRDACVEDVTDRVFLAIQEDPALLAEYERLCTKHGRGVVNRQGPKWVWKALGRPRNLGMGAARSKLIPSGRYSRFDVATMACR